MILLTWNVNGIRSLIREYGTIDAVFQVLSPDILCIQESRIGQDDLSVGYLPEGYDAFFSPCLKNKGYAGVMTYVRQCILPSSVYTNLQDLLASSIILDRDELYNKYESTFLKEASDEGRIVTLVYDNAIIMNIYFPANTEEKRVDFRQQFYNLIKDILLQLDQASYSLFIAGDFNTSCGIMDSAYLEQDHEKNGFIEQFRSMSEWLETIQLPVKEKGCGLVDTFRMINPTQRNAYTCFCNQFGGRATNFGSRIDYIFCSDAIKHTIKQSTILSTVKGSDHVPLQTQFDFVLHSKTTVKGIQTLVKAQHKINHFFVKQVKEKKPTQSVKRTSQEIELKEGEWACSRCTFVNKQTTNYCEICGTKHAKERFTEVGINTFFGKKKKTFKVPCCSGHGLPCTRHQGDPL